MIAEVGEGEVRDGEGAPTCDVQGFIPCSRRKTETFSGRATERSHASAVVNSECRFGVGSRAYPSPWRPRAPRNQQPCSDFSATRSKTHSISLAHMLTLRLIGLRFSGSQSLPGAHVGGVTQATGVNRGGEQA